MSKCGKLLNAAWIGGHGRPASLQPGRVCSPPQASRTSIVQRWLLIVKGWEAHALEVPSVPLLPPHHNPHGAPLSHVHGLNHPGDLIHKGDGPGDVVDDLDMAHLGGAGTGIAVGDGQAGGRAR